MDFRSRLLATLGAVRPVLDQPGVLVIGSEVPNLLALDAHEVLVVSQDVDIGVPVGVHPHVRERLRTLRGFHQSPEEPSVWLPEGELLEVNFVGIDPALSDPADAYVLDDPELPLLVFGALSLLQPGPPADVEGQLVPLPRPATLAIEKLLTERSGEKGERDLLVVLALLLVLDDAGWDELAAAFARLSPDQQHQARANATLLSLMEPHAGMPDPRRHRALAERVLARFDLGARRE